jgi:excisionase family DNA binding protein
MTVAETAQALGIGRTHAYRAIHEGKIGSIKLGGKILIPRAEVDRILNSGVKGD